jgi:hypothetical protein
MTLSELQAKLRAAEAWFHEKLGALLLLAFAYGLLSLVGLPDLHRAMRLLRSGHAKPVVIARGYSVVVFGSQGGTITAEKAQISGDTREFFADKRYYKGDHAFLTYSERLDYGVITQQPPQSLSDIVDVDWHAFSAASFPIPAIIALTITNLGLILLALLQHTIGRDLTAQLRERSGRFERGLTIGTAVLEGLLAGTIAFAPIAAISAAFSVAIQMEGDSLSSLYIVYVLLMLFLGSHVSAGAAIGLLHLLRSKFGRGLKEFIAYAASLTGALHVVRNIVQLTFSERVAELSSWWEVAKEFVGALFK